MEKAIVKPGLGVDAQGNPVIDPTANVLILVDAAVKRLDDLRAAENRRIEELLALETLRTKEVAQLHASYTEKLALAESKRIDAIRSVDVAAVAIASDKAAQQATVLARAVETSAENLRTNLTTLSNELIKRISTLEQSSYTGAGKSAVSDPMLVTLVDEMRSLRTSRDTGTGKSEGSSAVWGIIAAVIGLVVGSGGILIAILK
jgi:F0F1-type ATP synthase membrane subunit b/b'